MRSPADLPFRLIAFVIVLLLGAAAALLFREQSMQLLDWIRTTSTDFYLWALRNPWIALTPFLLISALAKSIGFGFVTMIVAGMIYGVAIGSLVAALGSALSGLMIAVLGRWLFKDAIEYRFASRIESYRPALERDGFRYLVAVRLMPFMPAWLANLLPVLIPISLLKVMAATFVGILPMAAILAWLGAGLTSIDQINEVSADTLFKPSILVPLLGLALITLAPALWRMFKAGGETANGRDRAGT